MADIQKIDPRIGIDAILESGFAWLEKHQWAKAKRHFDAALEIAPENPYVYLGKLLITLKLPNIDALPYAPSSFAGSPNYKKALQYSSDDLKQKLEDYLVQYKKNDEEYAKAFERFSKTKSTNVLKQLEETFIQLGDFKDAKQLAKSCAAKRAAATDQDKATATAEATAAAEAKERTLKGRIVFSIIAGVITLIIAIAVGEWFGFVIWGGFVGFPIVLYIWSEMRQIRNIALTARLSYYFRRHGQRDIERLESFLTTNQISLPKHSDDKSAYMQSLLTAMVQHYHSILRHNLSKAGYRKSFEFSGVGTVYYNANYALFYKDVFCTIELCIKRGRLVYRRYNLTSSPRNWSLAQLLKYCTSLTQPYETHAQKIPMSSLYWYVEYPFSSTYRLADTAAGAVLGGLMFGAVGALIGGMGANKSQKEKEDNVEVFFGEKSKNRKWKVASTEYESKRVANYLMTHLPNNRLPDTYKKDV